MVKVNNDPYLSYTLNDDEMKDFMLKLNKKNICHFYARNGWCKFNSECKYLHQKKKLICKYFVNGNCLKKDKCNFEHIIENKKICLKWIRNVCKFENNCNYRHSNVSKLILKSKFEVDNEK